MTKKKTIGRRTEIFGLILVASLLMGGCAAQRSVVIPHDWSTEKPQAPSARQPVPPTPVPGSATIRETNIPPEGAGAGSEAQGGAAGREPESPQLLASAQLVKQADLNLQRGAVEEAMSLYEQAIQIDVYNGDAFYGLARAWYRKGNYSQALEFGHKAEILFQGRAGKLKSLYLLEAKICQALNDNEAASAYLMKAKRFQ